MRSNTTSSNTTIPYSWIKHISPEQASLETLPRMGYPPAFPWDNLAAKLSEQFEIQNIHLEASNPQWLQPSDVFSGIGQPQAFFYGALSPLNGFWCWAMAEQDVNMLMSLLLSKNKIPLDIPNPQFREGFSRFLALETLSLIEQLDVDKDLSPRLTLEQPFEGPAYATDVVIGLLGKHLPGRFLLSRDLHQALKERYSQRKTNVSLSPGMAKQLQLTVHLEAGKTILSVSEWASVSLGDLLILDKCTVVPGEEKGRVMLTVNGTPIFRGMIKTGGIKILESPQYYEVEEPMANTPEDQNHEEGEEDLESEFDEDLELQEDTAEEDIVAGEEENLDLEYSEEHTVEESVEEEVEEKEKGAPTPKTTGEAPKRAPEGKPIPSVNELPMTVIVEVGRLQMTVQQLMDLQPGNMLELDTKPENGVDLVVNQRVVGKGELVLVGETLGVRIIDLGNK